MTRVNAATNRTLFFWGLGFGVWVLGLEYSYDAINLGKNVIVPRGIASLKTGILVIENLSFSQV